MPTLTHFESVDSYIASFSGAEQEVPRTIRAIIREAAPDTAEVISYQQPAHKLNGQALWSAGFKRHFSLFVPSERVKEAFAQELSRYEVHKATIRFLLAEPVPVQLIRDIAALRAEEARAHEKPKRAAPKQK
ncbi:MAG: DUF1801 domain-containing protein [Chloroflexi bacterium]|nr:DUF1801 domain-containing protein [Chloroflexota bacterium]